MPDAIGFTLATAFLATVLTVFGIIGRIVDGVTSEIRLTVAPAMVAGVRAWAEELGGAQAGRPDDDETTTGDDATSRDRHDAGAVIPIQTVRTGRHRGWQLFARMIRSISAVGLGRPRSVPG
jgi:hypothetical protein